MKGDGAMSYRLINSNALAMNYTEVNDLPCIYADLPNGLDGGYYDMTENNGTRWHQLFGTPERAAKTLEAIPCGNLPCSKCPIFKPCCCDGVKEDEETLYDLLLKWLGGDAE